MQTGPKPVKLRQALAQELRNARRRREYSQEKLAFLAGLHRTYVSLLERGLKSPTVDVLERLALPLGEKPSTLLARAESNVGPERGHA